MSGIATSSCYLAIALAAFCFSFMASDDALHYHGTFWTYAVISFLGLLFCLIFVPETRGMSLDEMDPAKDITDEESSSASGERTPESADSSSCSTSTTDVPNIV